MSTHTPEDETLRIATFKIPTREYRQLEEIAQRDERSVSAVLRLAVRSYLDEKAAA